MVVISTTCTIFREDEFCELRVDGVLRSSRERERLPRPVR
jgi:hypothetical protein